MHALYFEIFIKKGPTQINAMDPYIVTYFCMTGGFLIKMEDHLPRHPLVR